jgi:hypothetical protein
MAHQKIKLDSGEVKDFITHIVTNNRQLQERGIVPIAVEVVGEAGLGKTTVLKDLGHQLGLEPVKINVAQLDELSDIIGYAIRQFKMCKKDASQPHTVTQTIFETKIVEEDKKLPNGTIIKVKKKIDVPVEKQVESILTDDCLWVDEQAIAQYTAQGYDFTGEKRMSYCPPAWVAGKSSGILLILDDWTRKYKKTFAFLN